MLKKRTFLLTIIQLLIAISSFAQPGGPGGGDPGPGKPVPIQGLLYLLVAGVFLGIRKIVKKNKV
jgi:hypothetical protein